MVDMPVGDESQEGSLLRVTREPVADGVVVHVAGEVDLATAPQLVGELVELENQAPLPAWLVLDLTDVTFLASVGLSALVEHDKRCRDAGVELRVVAGNRIVARAITLTGLAETLRLFDTIDQATAGS